MRTSCNYQTKIYSIYNKNKPFVDIADRMVAQIKYPHRIYKWTKAAMWAMLSIALWNACLVFKHVSKSEVSFPEFCMNLVDRIAETYISNDQSEEEDEENEHCYHVPLSMVQHKCDECLKTKARNRANSTKARCLKCRGKPWLCGTCFRSIHDLPKFKFV